MFFYLQTFVSDFMYFSIINRHAETFLWQKLIERVFFVTKNYVLPNLAMAFYKKTVPILFGTVFLCYLVDFFPFVRFGVAGLFSLSFMICKQVSTVSDAGSESLGIL